jgi:hypothetical protein
MTEQSDNRDSRRRVFKFDTSVARAFLVLSAPSVAFHFTDASTSSNRKTPMQSKGKSLSPNANALNSIRQQWRAVHWVYQRPRSKGPSSNWEGLPRPVHRGQINIFGPEACESLTQSVLGIFGHVLRAHLVLSPNSFSLQ